MAMLRLASSTVVPNALRAIASPTILSGSITSAFSSGSQDSIVKRERPFISAPYFSTDAKKSLDREFVKVLKSEIKSKQSFLDTTMPAAPADFPFKIQDFPCERAITLTREFDGEKIDVVVYPPRNVPGDDEEESDSTAADVSDDDRSDNGEGDSDDSSSSADSGSDEENENSGVDLAPGLGLFVNITKQNGKRLDLGVYISADGIKVGAMSIKEPATESDDTLICFGEYLVEQGSDLEIALREFLEIRGIKKFYFGFLYKYMVRKSEQDPMLVLEKVKKFIKD